MCELIKDKEMRENYEEVINDLEKQIEQLQKDKALLEKVVVNAYECGHNDTVESNYCDPEERAQEIIDEALNSTGEDE